MPLRIGVPREIFPDEKRVATVPEVVEKLVKLGFHVAVETGAGDTANFADESYRARVPKSCRPPGSSGPNRTSSSRFARQPPRKWR